MVIFLSKNWSFNSFHVILKQHRPLFDSSREKLDLVSVWVKLSGHIPQQWKLEVFICIGNELGKFSEVYMSF